jgi:hypothetical protein
LAFPAGPACIFFKREKEKKGASQERESWAFGQYERGGSLPFSFLFFSIQNIFKSV